MNKKVAIGLLVAAGLYMIVRNYNKKKELTALKDAVTSAANSTPTASTGGTVVTPTPPTTTGSGAPTITPNADKVPAIGGELAITPMSFPPTTTGTIAANDAVIQSAVVEKPVLPMVY